VVTSDWTERLDACGDEPIGSIGRELGGDQILRRCNRCIDRVAPQLAHRFHLGADDLLLGELYAGSKYSSSDWRVSRNCCALRKNWPLSPRPQGPFRSRPSMRQYSASGPSRRRPMGHQQRRLSHCSLGVWQFTANG
jgi:hypothetical protein